MQTPNPIRWCSFFIGVAFGLAGLTGAMAAPTSDSPLAPPPNGPRSVEPTHHVLVGAVIHPEPGVVWNEGMIVIRDGVIVQAGDVSAKGIALPAGARVHRLDGRHLYAGFIDAWVQVDGPEIDPDAPGSHWNRLMTPQVDVLDGMGLDDDRAESLREMGFTAAFITPKGGIMRGQGAVVSTGEYPDDPSERTPAVYRAGAGAVIGYARGNRDEEAYPTSHMGVVSLIRQTFLDADLRQKFGSSYADPSCLDAVNPAGGATFWNCSNAGEMLLAGKVMGEFGYDRLVLVGAGDAYQRLGAFASLGSPIVTALRFPGKPDVSSIGAADAVSLNQLMAWEQAPTNPRRLAGAGLMVALTSSKLPKGAEFHKNLRRALDEGGLTADAALAMLTTNPAGLLGVEGTLGTIAEGMAASFVVSDGNLFAGDEAEILDVWTDGVRHEINEPLSDAFDGKWQLVVGPLGQPAFEMLFTVDGDEIDLDEGGNHAAARDVCLDPPNISFLVDDTDDGTGTYIVSGALQPDGTIRGGGVGPDQAVFEWVGLRVEEVEEEVEVKKTPSVPADRDTSPFRTEEGLDDLPPEDLGGAPFGAYALSAPPAPQTVVFENATVWTSGADGILENGWVIVEDGKVVATGSGVIDHFTRGDPVVIDCAGKHITPGLIDAHSHTSLFGFGVNEAGQAITAECRIADSVNPTHINWYRQLAGGTTTANMLHGSANPMGGQSQTVKNRWGSTRAEALFFDGAPLGIKFALGENVKQSNWGDKFKTRYPQTRMGVEAIMRDRFIAAREYAKDKKAWEPVAATIREAERTLSRAMNQTKVDTAIEHGDSGASGISLAINDYEITLTIPDGKKPFRRDLELDALAEILDGERRVHCHSYRQDEILMLCRVAEEFGFKIGTFQHGLETYKVAEAVREHAIGASLFSDWWAYKVEVTDAIPYAGPIDHAAGIVVSYNSDSDELARRMNLEAAKAVKYSGGAISPADALKFVTLNPAIQLGIDARVGSLEPGKDADLVVWSGDPLSVYSRCERVFVDGREYFSLEQDAAHRERIAAERGRILQKIIAATDEPDAADERSESSGFDQHQDTRGTCGCDTIHSHFQEIR